MGPGTRGEKAKCAQPQPRTMRALLLPLGLAALLLTSAPAAAEDVDPLHELIVIAGPLGEAVEDYVAGHVATTRAWAEMAASAILGPLKPYTRVDDATLWDAACHPPMPERQGWLSTWYLQAQAWAEDAPMCAATAPTRLLS